MSSCPECGGCENTGTQPCPACQPQADAELALEDDWEPCDHACDEDGYDYQHCFACGGCGCPGYCDA